METRTNDGRRLWLMTLNDKFCRCLAIHVARRINALGVIETLADVMLFEGIPAYIQSDKRSGDGCEVLREWLKGWAARAFTSSPDYLGRMDAASRSTQAAR